MKPKSKPHSKSVIHNDVYDSSARTYNVTNALIAIGIGRYFQLTDSEIQKGWLQRN